MIIDLRVVQFLRICRLPVVSINWNPSLIIGGLLRCMGLFQSFIFPNKLYCQAYVKFGERFMRCWEDSIFFCTWVKCSVEHLNPFEYLLNPFESQCLSISLFFCLDSVWMFCPLVGIGYSIYYMTFDVWFKLLLYFFYKYGRLHFLHRCSELRYHLDGFFSLTINLSLWYKIQGSAN